MLRKIIAEMLGTFLLVLFGCGTAVIVQCSAMNMAGYICTSFAFGFIIMALASTIGRVSGCHVNPAVSLAMFLDRRISAIEFIGYVISQFAGAVLGAYALKYFTGPYNSLGVNALYAGSFFKTALFEIILTFVFVLVILCVTDKKAGESINKHAGLYIGLTLVLVHLFGIGFDGTSVNPARSFGPALAKGIETLADVPAFIAGPMIGSVLAWLFYRLVIRNEYDKKSNKKLRVKTKPVEHIADDSIKAMHQSGGSEEAISIPVSKDNQELPIDEMIEDAMDDNNLPFLM